MAVYVVDIPEDVQGMDEVLQALTTAKQEAVRLLPKLIESLNNLQLVERTYRYTARHHEAVVEALGEEGSPARVQFEQGWRDDLVLEARSRGLLLLEEPTVTQPDDMPFAFLVRARAFVAPAFDK